MSSLRHLRVKLSVTCFYSLYSFFRHSQYLQLQSEMAIIWNCKADSILGDGIFPLEVLCEKIQSEKIRQENTQRTRHKVRRSIRRPHKEHRRSERIHQDTIQRANLQQDKIYWVNKTFVSSQLFISLICSGPARIYSRTKLFRPLSVPGGL